MMLIEFKDIFYKPIYPLKTMMIIAIVLAIIVLLNRKHIINRLLIIALLVIISQRPMVKERKEPAKTLDANILFVINTKPGMNAIDIDGKTRLDEVKKDCFKIMEKLPNANYALITFDWRSHVRSSYTSNVGTMRELIDNLKVTDPFYMANKYKLTSSTTYYQINPTGNVITGYYVHPYDAIYNTLSSLDKSDKNKNIVIFIGHETDVLDASKNYSGYASYISKYLETNKLIDYGAVLGYGTKEGGKIKLTESIALDDFVNSEGYLIGYDIDEVVPKENSERQYEMDVGSNNKSHVIISKIDEESLQKAANFLDVDYIHMPDETKLMKKLDAIKSKVHVTTGKLEERDKDIYYYFSCALIFLLFSELYHYRRDER